MVLLLVVLIATLLVVGASRAILIVLIVKLTVLPIITALVRGVFLIQVVVLILRFIFPPCPPCLHETPFTLRRLRIPALPKLILSLSQITILFISVILLSSPFRPGFIRELSLGCSVAVVILF